MSNLDTSLLEANMFIQQLASERFQHSLEAAKDKFSDAVHLSIAAANIASIPTQDAPREFRSTSIFNTKLYNCTTYNILEGVDHNPAAKFSRKWDFYSTKDVDMHGIRLQADRSAESAESAEEFVTEPADEVSKSGAEVLSKEIVIITLAAVEDSQTVVLSLDLQINLVCDHAIHHLRDLATDQELELAGARMMSQTRSL
ncbi:uncharacterized protein RSE6_05307 [Rhynchosporium secalis]|uniref:Uncharacterized protein n=1 Tax=Rhynchosporium secalis TaxID=38038 RepID=A0A1E1M7G8_RHYSE|nr:uncharacterized protein RSE6_05307 [Rhynchosporium secalis]